MSLNLPAPIALYVSAANRNSPQSAKDCFAEDAVVQDEGETISGVAAIQQWMADTHARYHHTTQPLFVQQEGQVTNVTCRVTGNFPGSPIDLPFRFTLRDSKIAKLDIG